MNNWCAALYLRVAWVLPDGASLIKLRGDSVQQAVTAATKHIGILSLKYYKPTISIWTASWQWHLPLQHRLCLSVSSVFPPFSCSYLSLTQPQVKTTFVESLTKSWPAPCYRSICMCLFPVIQTCVLTHTFTFPSCPNVLRIISRPFMKLHHAMDRICF